MFTLALLVNV